MVTNYKRWQKLLLWCFGLFTAAAFCMKWIEADFVSQGKKFTMIGMEISLSKEKLSTLLAGLDDHVRALVRYHLSFDFVFMAGVYPGIAALCMMAREKSGKLILKRILFMLALWQMIAWGCDIAENRWLFKWIKDPRIGNDFNRYHFIVASKWVIALLGAFISIPLALKRKLAIGNKQ